MAFPEQVEKLVDRLTKLSEEDKVPWEATADDTTFLAPVSKFVVTVAEVETYDGIRYDFAIRSDDGRIIDEVLATRGEDWIQLRDLHSMARRKALHVDEALSDLLSSLERI